MIELLVLAAAIWLSWRLRAQERRLAAIQVELDSLRMRLAQVELTGAPESAPVADVPAAPVAVAVEEAPASIPETPAASEPFEAVAEGEEPRRRGLEELLTVRWSVWLGGAALALAAIFLVRYSIEQGWLGPAVRVAAGIVFGLALLAGAEWVRRRELVLALLPDLRHASISASLAASGIVALYAAIYGGFELYGLFTPLLAFAVLAAISGLSLLLALLHGPLLAVLGQIGGFAVPALVGGPEPSAWTLFAYLFAVTAGVVALARYRGWGWTAWIALVAVTLWSGLWIQVSFQPGDGLPVGLFILAVACLFAWPGAQAGEGDAAGLDDPGPVALAVLAVLAGVLVARDGYAPVSLILFALLAAISIGRLRLAQDVLAAEWAAGLVFLLLVLAWPMPAAIERPEALGLVEGRAAGYAAGPVVPPSLGRFIGWTAAIGALFGIAGTLALWGARAPWRWAAFAAAMPVALFAAAYWKVTRFDAALPWAAAALLLAAAFLGVAAYLARYRARPGMAYPLAAYAVGVTAAVTLACVTTLRSGWLTVALAVEVAAIAWIHARTALPVLRQLALALAVVAIVRLLLNPAVAAYEVGTAIVFNGLLYTYGLPALAFAAAARLFAAERRDHVVEVLEGGTVAFLVALVTLQIRHAACGGQLVCRESGLVEVAALTLAWGVIGYALYRARRWQGGLAVAWGARLVTFGAVAILLFGSLGFANPLFRTVQVGAWPVFNQLALAYLLPAVLALAFWHEARRRGEAAMATGAAVAALLLGLVYVTLEVRRAFLGGSFRPEAPGDAEYYAYSAAWLAYGGALLAVGLWRRRQWVRYASLAVILLAVAKVFLFDMAALTGLYRALSFLGLGLALLLIGWLYQHHVFPRQEPRPEPDVRAV